MYISEKVMQLTEKKTGRFIGNIPPSHGKTVDDCIKYLGGEIVNSADGQPQCDSGKNVIIRGSSYNYGNLIVTEQVIRDSRIGFLANETYHYSDVDYFANDCARSVNFATPDEVPESEIMPVVEQLRIFWHVVRDPVETFLDKMKLADPCFPVEELRGEKSLPVTLRLTLASLSRMLDVQKLIWKRL